MPNTNSAQGAVSAHQAHRGPFAAGHPSSGYPGTCGGYAPQLGPQGASVSAHTGPSAGLAGSPVPGGGAPDGGLSAAYAAWAAAYGGSNTYAGAMPTSCGGGAKGSSSGVGEKGEGRGRGMGKGKGKGKTWKTGAQTLDPTSGPSSWLPPGDPRRQIELAQKRAKQRDRSAISQAQRSAQQRFERDLLERVQGSWADASDPNTTYAVEGSLCSVSGGENSRVFRNRLGVYGGELCWDARRFWHYLNLSALPPLGEVVERVEWNPGEGSPPTRPIVWIRTGAQLDDAEEPAPSAAEPEAVPCTAEAVAEAVVA